MFLLKISNNNLKVTVIYCNRISKITFLFYLNSIVLLVDFKENIVQYAYI
jgi:hypothetical protein